jgi:hypothetical protein
MTDVLKISQLANLGAPPNSSSVLPIVEGGQTKKVTVAHLLTNAGTGTVTQINTAGAITGGAITVSGTITHLDTAGYKHIPSGGTTGQILGWNADGTATWQNATVAAQYTNIAGTPVIRVNAQTIDQNVTLAATENGLTAGPISISSGIIVTITSGAYWTIV